MAVEDSAGGARSSNPQATETAPPDKDDSKETEASALEVLNRYRSLLRQSEKEREAFLSTLHDLNLPHKETHWLDWNIRFLETEIEKVKEDQNHLADMLSLEVHRGTNLKDDIRRLEEQNVEDRMRIQRLVALSQPVEPDITFTARPSGPFGVGGALDWDEEENVEDWLQNLMANERDPMLREQLMAIQGMAEDIEAAKRSYQEEVVKLMSQRSMREIQAERRLREVLKKLGDAGETLRQRELDLEEATRQYLQLICDSQGFKNQCLDEQASLVQERRQLVREMLDFRGKVRRDAETLRLLILREREGDIAHLESQLQSLEDEICMLVEQYRTEKPLFEKRIQTLETKLGAEKAKYKKENTQSKLDQEGYQVDVKSLQQQWTKAKKLEQQLRRLGHDDFDDQEQEDDELFRGLGVLHEEEEGEEEEGQGGRRRGMEETDLQELMWKLEIFSKERQRRRR